MTFNSKMRIALVAFATCSAYVAVAQERPVIGRMSCAEATAMVREQGEVVVSTGPAGYERVVRDGGYCAAETTPAPNYLATADQRSCFVGYRCKDINRGEGRNE